MSRRTERINELLQQEISRIVQNEVRDPRLSTMVTITRVEVSADLHHATVSVTTLGDEQTEREALRGLRSASGFLRRELGQRLQLRHTPELRFVPDIAARQGDHVLGLLDKIRTEEHQKNDA